MKTAFPDVKKIQYEGPKSKNPLAFKHYNADEMVAGKSMREHLRFAVVYWHTFRGTGSDPFGAGTMIRPWDDGTQSVNITNTKDVDSISNDMAAFVKRVPNEKYEAVQKEMTEKKVVAELTELAGFVRQNLGLKSVGRARQWGDQLDEWATMLQSE